MIEEYCRSDIWTKCREVTGVAPLVSLKGAVKAWEYDGFYDGSSAYGIVWQWDRKRGSNETFRKAVGFFSRNGRVFCQGYVDDCFKGDWRKAILHHGNFDSLFLGFEEYFGERKIKFMEKTVDIIKQLRPDIKSIKQLKTNSHGGVANLLKVLTKTMNEQGASIRSIAKMQYGICCQAGIYLPDEFITDVLVATDINPEAWKIDEEVKK